MPTAGYRYLVNLPNVSGGNTIIDGTRIGVHDVVGLIVNGSTVDDVVRSFPDLTPAQVFRVSGVLRGSSRRNGYLGCTTNKPRVAAADMP
jgi:uncharacterized protein (DUF433 family)